VYGLQKRKLAAQSALEPVRCAAASSYTDKRTALSGANQRLPLDLRVKPDLRSLAMIKQIKFVSIPVADQNRALDFYTEKLGFTIITDQPFDEKQRWIELRVPKAETRVVLFNAEGDEKRIGSMMPMSYACDDIDKTYEELKGRGVDFEGPPQKQPWGKYAMFKDSEGNRFVLSAD
jgi:predicted enzyme related to lactoylglutathione lyase